MVHYQPTVPHAIFMRGVSSVLAQTFKDYELLVYHDGPLVDPSLPSPVPIIPTAKRFNDWGHSLREIGIRECTGEYVLNTNADNIYYPNALEEIEKAIARPARIIHQATGAIVDTNNVLVFPVIMRGSQRFYDNVLYYPTRPDFYTILTGNPPAMLMIDCMQLVMRRDIWLAEGGWYDKTREADGVMYPKFAQKYGYRAVEPILGEHF